MVTILLLFLDYFLSHRRIRNIDKYSNWLSDFFSCSQSIKGWTYLVFRKIRHIHDEITEHVFCGGIRLYHLINLENHWNTCICRPYLLHFLLKTDTFKDVYLQFTYCIAVASEPVICVTSTRTTMLVFLSTGGSNFEQTSAESLTCSLTLTLCINIPLPSVTVSHL